MPVSRQSARDFVRMGRSRSGPKSAAAMLPRVGRDAPK